MNARKTEEGTEDVQQQPGTNSIVSQHPGRHRFKNPTGTKTCRSLAHLQKGTEPKGTLPPALSHHRGHTITTVALRSAHPQADAGVPQIFTSCDWSHPQMKNPQIQVSCILYAHTCLSIQHPHGKYKTECATWVTHVSMPVHTRYVTPACSAQSRKADLMPSQATAKQEGS